MVSGGVNEIIWHFAGYLQLTPEADGAPGILYEGAGNYTIGLDEAVGHGPGRAHERPEHLGSTRAGFAELVVPSPYHWYLRPHGKFSHLPVIHVHPPKIALPKLPMPPLPPAGGGAAGGGESVPVTYHGGGDQNLIYVPQVNWLINNNNVDGPSGVVAQNDDHAAKALSWMLHEAADASFDSALQPAGVDTTSLQNWVNARDSQAPQIYGHDAPSAQQGTTVNGVFEGDAGANVHQPTNDVINNAVAALNQGFAGPPPAPIGDGAVESAHTVSVGSNIMLNDAVLTNLDGLSNSLVVLGSYYQTNAIVQTNVFNEQDHVHVNASAGASISIAPNTIQNIADFDNAAPTLTSASGTTASGLNWTVDVLNGSLLDVHSLVQTNYLSNNDVVYQTTSTGISQIVTGGNDLVNSSFATLAANYDLIIVEGSYHQDALIYQTNVVLDSNFITLSGGGGAQSVIGGQNTVVNDGSITDVGSQTFQPMTAWSEGMVQELTGNQPSVEASLIASAFPGLSGTAHVLIVTGDYYDINYISQTNVLSDANVVSMAGSGKQTIVTGHDQVLNAASIIDGVSVNSPYLQGNYYNDMILIQSNIISDGERITGSNPNQLAPELVAFTSPTETSPQGPSTGSTSAELHHHYHHDIISGILH
ncbi:MAG TPA: hypothetical protein VEK55_11105 [Xanthobacteraceae bacterium]|nr:hypothetical protein [Xanthobacteraceae bacterium]